MNLQRFGAWSRCLSGILLWVGGARAAEVDWIAPPGCAQEVFVTELERGAEASLDAIPVTAIEVELTRQSESEWSACFALRQASGQRSPERQIEGRSCDDVSRAAAVAVAMALQAEQVAQSSGTGESAEGPSPSTEAGPSEPVEGEQQKSRGPLPWHGAALVSALLDTALLGQMTPGAALGGDVGLGRFSLGVGAGVLFPVERRLEQDLGIALSAVLLGGQLCFAVLKTRIRPHLCLGYQIDWVQGRGTGNALAVARQQSAVWQALQPALSVSFPTGGAFEVRALAGASIGLTHAQFVIDQGQVAHQLPDVSVQVALSFAWRHPAPPGPPGPGQL